MIPKNLARTAHAVGQNCFHLIWTPKYRYPIFRFKEVEVHLRLAMKQVGEKHNIKIHELCIENDHIHMFVELPSTMSLSKAFQLLKGGSSYLMRKRLYWLQKYKAFWEIGKFYRSVGAVTDVAIKRYINDGHHMSKAPKDQTKLEF